MADGNFDNLTVSGISDLGGNVQVGGNVAVGDLAAGLIRTLNVTGAMYGANTLSVAGTITGGSMLNVSGAVTGGSLNISSAITGSSLTITGAITGGALTISSASNLHGAAHLRHTLQVDGTSSLATLSASGAINGADTLTISGATDLHGTVHLHHTLQVGGSTSLLGNVAIGNSSPDHVLVVGPATGGRHLVINDIPAARWGFATGNYALSFQNDGSNGNWTTRFWISQEGNVGIGKDVLIQGKHAFRGTDPWLRINQDSAFVGTHTPGFFNAHSLTVGALYTDPGLGNLAMTGSLLVGAGGWGRIKVRHLDGKHWQNDNDDPLYLNWGTQQPVVIGGGNGTEANLHLSGRLGVLGQPPQPRREGLAGGIRTWDLEAEGTIVCTNDIIAEGRLRGRLRDVAENFVADAALQPGDVVILDQGSDTVRLSQRPNDVLVCGVISTAPGLLLGDDVELDAKYLVPVALCGRLPCKVTDENGPIRRGDLITTSSTPGHAMKACPIDVNGEAFYRPNTIIGKALEPLDVGIGMVDIFVGVA